jgi:hypothetical protein
MSTERPVFVAHTLCPPIRLPDKVQKPKWARPIKAHGKASAWSLTDPEAAEKEAYQAEIEARKQTQEDTTEVVPNSPVVPLRLQAARERIP